MSDDFGAILNKSMDGFTRSTGLIWWLDAYSTQDIVEVFEQYRRTVARFPGREIDVIADISSDPIDYGICSHTAALYLSRQIPLITIITAEMDDYIE